jgi:hypothetical protein
MPNSFIVGLGTTNGAMNIWSYSSTISLSMSADISLFRRLNITLEYEKQRSGNFHSFVFCLERLVRIENTAPAYGQNDRISHQQFNLFSRTIEELTPKKLIRIYKARSVISRRFYRVSRSILCETLLKHSLKICLITRFSQHIRLIDTFYYTFEELWHLSATLASLQSVRVSTFN